MRINIFLVIFIALLLILMIQLCKNNESFSEHFTNQEKDKKDEIEVVKRPFVNLYDNLGNRLNVILISKYKGRKAVTATNQNRTSSPVA